MSAGAAFCPALRSTCCDSARTELLLAAIERNIQLRAAAGVVVDFAEGQEKNCREQCQPRHNRLFLR